MEPQYTHDCDFCIFIGRVERGSGIWRTGGWYSVDEREITWPTGDLWLHPAGGLLVRTGDDGPEYHSMGDAYFAALPDEWKPMARSMWRHYDKPDDYDYERMRKARTRRRQDRRIRRSGREPWLVRMESNTGFPDYYEDEI